MPVTGGNVYNLTFGGLHLIQHNFNIAALRQNKLKPVANLEAVFDINEDPAFFAAAHRLADKFLTMAAG